MALEIRKKRQEQGLLEEVSMFNQSLRDEIVRSFATQTKEIKLSAEVQQSCQNRLSQLQHEAVSMCKSIELEKKKHVKSTKTQEDLRAIIQHMEGKLQQGRRNEAAFGLTFNDKKGGEESLEGVTKHYQKLEYDFDQLVQKHNESLAQINEIRIKVNASRAERVIYSGVFRNIEREIRLMEEEYMKLLIERGLAEMEKEKVERQNARKQDEIRRKDLQMKHQQIKQSRRESMTTTNFDISEATDLEAMKKTADKVLEEEKEGKRIKEGERQNDKTSLQKQIAEIEHIKAETGLNNAIEQLPYYMDRIEEINGQLHEESNTLAYKIDAVEQKMRLSNLKKGVLVVQHQSKGEREKLSEQVRRELSIKHSILELNNRIKAERDELLNKQQLDKIAQVCKLLGLEPFREQHSEERVCESYRVLQRGISSFIESTRRPEVDAANSLLLPKQKQAEGRRLTQFIEQTDKKESQWQKLLGHQDFEEAYRKDFERMSRRPVKTMIVRTKRT